MGCDSNQLVDIDCSITLKLYDDHESDQMKGEEERIELINQSNQRNSLVLRNDHIIANAYELRHEVIPKSPFQGRVTRFLTLAHAGIATGSCLLVLVETTLMLAGAASGR